MRTGEMWVRTRRQRRKDKRQSRVIYEGGMQVKTLTAGPWRGGKNNASHDFHSLEVLSLWNEFTVAVCHGGVNPCFHLVDCFRWIKRLSGLNSNSTKDKPDGTGKLHSAICLHYAWQEIVYMSAYLMPSAIYLRHPQLLTNVSFCIWVSSDIVWGFRKEVQPKICMPGRCVYFNTASSCSWLKPC